MSNPLDDIKTSHTLHKVVPAEDFNRVRLALSRLGNSIELELPSIQCLEMLLTDKYWLCVDSCNDNQPVMAWTEFESVGRDALDAPVECELRLYHCQAGLVMGTVLDCLERELETRLDALK